MFKGVGGQEELYRHLHCLGTLLRWRKSCVQSLQSHPELAWPRVCSMLYHATVRADNRFLNLEMIVLFSDIHKIFAFLQLKSLWAEIKRRFLTILKLNLLFLNFHMAVWRRERSSAYLSKSRFYRICITILYLE